MEIIMTVAEMQRICDKIRLENKKICVVPTMGYLHEGHTSLMRIAKNLADIVITTLFVNPKQFAPNEDFEKYPRDIDRDSHLAETNGTDYLFIPDVREIYPIGYNTKVEVDGVTNKFEGISRPSHFSGVATVVAKLFNCTKPHFAVFGQKDYQQCLLIKRMTIDLNFDINIIIAPTIREHDGLAMSSRNSYLSLEHRAKAGIIFKAIEEAKRVISIGQTDRKIINSHMLKVLKEVYDIRIDYVASALSETLEEPEHFFPGDKIVLLIACYLGKTRLIDNSVCDIPYSGKFN
ncbi:MAG: pantoate--beta-alanine ligase [Desulfobulbaceae bacterium]|nr:pantoate--beta-alanine ligase [Candidatus Kapabacteria bacterium]MBS3999107.1 pantoate--beta-alanine ligase [Desulfobulbaceae bacterium]